MSDILLILITISSAITLFELVRQTKRADRAERALARVEAEIGLSPAEIAFEARMRDVLADAFTPAEIECEIRHRRDAIAINPQRDRWPSILAIHHEARATDKAAS